MERSLIIYVVFFIGFSYAAVLPNQKDDSDLDTKISQLRDLVNEIKNANEKGSSQHASSGSSAKESDMAATSSSVKAHTRGDSALSPEEITLLKKLKDTLEEETAEEKDGLKIFQESVKHERRPEHVGTFLDRPIPEQEVPDTSRVKQLAALMSQRSQSTPEEIEGNGFGKFHETVLNVLVDRLLEDTDLLLRKGFSLDDVLKNLSGKAQMERERTSLEQALEKLLDEKHI
ncbi:uncharacterized protein LOC128186482 isoform X2 [Crassostrea angulata]|uniref:uncharacterized protein LOC128186482 isoform X2 n=1 Tax=Magallana angulata TaxID=2784310 RepID=UPI0022B1D44F|nr:uncharacterized protein LOC128186482 isoform X2 [Crassostrea angulata]